MSDTENIWEATVDEGTWGARVEPTEDSYRGVLVVTHMTDGKEILRKEVGVSYGALFGPDAADVSDWQVMTIEAIEKFEDSQ